MLIVITRGMRLCFCIYLLPSIIFFILLASKVHAESFEDKTSSWMNNVDINTCFLNIANHFGVSIKIEGGALAYVPQCKLSQTVLESIRQVLEISGGNNFSVVSDNDGKSIVVYIQPLPGSNEDYKTSLPTPTKSISTHDDASKDPMLSSNMSVRQFEHIVNATEVLPTNKDSTIISSPDSATGISLNEFSQMVSRNQDDAIISSPSGHAISSKQFYSINNSEDIDNGRVKISSPNGQSISLQEFSGYTTKANEEFARYIGNAFKQH